MTSKRTFEASMIIALAMMGVEIPKPERPENDIEGVPIDELDSAEEKQEAPE